MPDKMCLKKVLKCQSLRIRKPRLPIPGKLLVQLVPVLVPDHVAEVAARIEVQNQAVKVTCRDDLKKNCKEKIRNQGYLPHAE